ncbi:MAG: YqgE/AlgH family protein [Planctomycetota bacterium]|jgi:putative transcriptional regulator
MSNALDSTQGKALLASPYLEDPNFQQSVVYMVRHNDDEAFGLIVNRPTEHSVSSVLEQAANANLDRDGWLYFGGPVEGPLVALHDQAELADLQCSNGLYLTSDRDLLLRLIGRAEAKVKLFAGFSGWGPGQLEAERSTESWFVSDISLHEVLGDSDHLWRDLLYRIGHALWSETGFDFGDPSRAGWN